jgi:hypothetical protein
VVLALRAGEGRADECGREQRDGNDDDDAESGHDFPLLALEL